MGVSAKKVARPYLADVMGEDARSTGSAERFKTLSSRHGWFLPSIPVWLTLQVAAAACGH